MAKWQDKTGLTEKKLSLLRSLYKQLPEKPENWNPWGEPKGILRGMPQNGSGKPIMDEKIYG